MITGVYPNTTVQQRGSYPSSASNIRCPNASEIARMLYMKRTAPARMFPDGPLITVTATSDQLMHLMHVSEQWDDKVLTFEDFLMIEESLSKMKYSLRGRRYVLVPVADQEGLSIKSSAQLYEMEAFLALPNEPTQEICGLYGGSLGTPLTLRNQGYAAALVKDLISQSVSQTAGEYRLYLTLAKEQGLYKGLSQSNPSISAKIPSDFDFNSMQTTHKPVEVGDSNVGNTLNTFVDFVTQPIYESGMEDFVREDATRLKAECQELSLRTGKPVVCMVPSVDCLQHRTARSTLCFQYHLGSSRLFDESRTQCGCSIGNPADKDWAYILWRTSFANRTHSEKELIIARVRYSSVAQLKILLQAAHDTAKSWGLTNGIFWSTSSNNNEALDELGITFVENIGNYYIPLTRLSLSGVENNIDHILFTPEMYYSPR